MEEKFFTFYFECNRIFFKSDNFFEKFWDLFKIIYGTPHSFLLKLCFATHPSWSYNNHPHCNVSKPKNLTCLTLKMFFLSWFMKYTFGSVAAFTPQNLLFTIFYMFFAKLGHQGKKDKKHFQSFLKIWPLWLFTCGSDIIANSTPIKFGDLNKQGWLNW